jgi:molybdenum cofactor cytidylyltransferase
MSAPVWAVVPAAGLSRRMGGPNKLLMPWGEGTIVGSVVATLVQCGLEVVVVTGRDAAAVAAAVGPVRTVHNAAFEQGLGGSIATGVAACGHADGYLVALGDMPGLRADVVRSLIETLRIGPPDAIVAPVYDGEPDRPGHPILFGPAYRRELEELHGDEGGKAVLRAHQSHLRLLGVEGILQDVDRPEDLPSERWP